MARLEIDRNTLYKFFARETTPEEADIIGKWLDAAPANKEEFEKAYDAFMVEQLNMTDKERIADTGFFTGNGKPQVFSSRRISLYISGIAAALAIGSIAGWKLSDVSTVSKMEGMTLVSETEPGQRTTVELSDGSVINLNSGSRLEYQPVFLGKERRVKLTGEAVFEVSHDEKHPFIVETYACDVKVLGTRFDVIADSASGKFSTALLEGKVRILDKSERLIADLEPGSILCIEQGKITKSVIPDNENYLWTDGIISAARIPFDQIMERFSRCYGVNIVIGCKELPKTNYPYLKLRISDGIEHGFDVLRQSCDFTYRYDEISNTYYIN